MSVSSGRPGGKRHNVRSEYREGLANVDPARTPMNSVLVDVDLAEAYESLFGEAVAAHNERVSVSHPERSYGPMGSDTGYLAKMRASRRERPSYELVVQLGNRDTNPASDPDCRLASGLVYRDWLQRFQAEFPHLRVVTAAIHVDEATPHLHVEYVPWTDAPCRRGLAVRNSLRQAMRQDGYTDVRDLNGRLFELLEEAARGQGIERVEMGCHARHLTVADYRRSLEDSERGAYPYRNDPALLDLVQRQQEVIERQGALLEEVQALPTQNPFSLARELREVQDAIRRADLRGAARQLAGVVREIPSLWAEHVVNPVTDAMRRAREAWREPERPARLAGQDAGFDLAEEMAGIYAALGGWDGQAPGGRGER